MTWIGFLAGIGVLLAPPALAPASGAGLLVVTTVPAVYCFTANVAGSLAVVENLLPPGASAHDFQFTAAERRKLERADLIIANGLGLESWLDKALRKSSRTNIVYCAAGLGAELIPPGSPTPNPHVWLDPTLACRMVTNILLALQQADPINAAAYAARAAAFVARLQALDQELFAGLATLTNRAIVTSHDAFPYFARRYGLTVAGVVEERSELEPSPAHLTALRAAIQQHGVKVLWVDPHEATRRTRQLGRDFKVAVGLLDPLEAAPLAAAAYEDGMRRNLRALLQSLD